MTCKCLVGVQCLVVPSAWDAQSRFISGLIVVIIVFAFYALTSNPPIHILFGCYASGPSPFAILPDAFTTLALVVLFNLSLE